MNFKILVINLDRAAKRRQAALKQLDHWCSHVERISAADAEILSESVLHQHYSLTGNQKCYHKLLKNSEKGCYLSHIWCWQKIVEEQLDFAIVLEDDFVLKGDLSLLLNDLRQLPRGWHYLKLAALKAGKTRSIITRRSLQHFTLVDYSKNPILAMAQAVSYDGARLLLQKALPFKRPIDVDLQYTWELGIKAQGLLPYCFEGNTAFSSQMKGRKQAQANFPLRLKLSASYWLRNTMHNMKTYGITTTMTAKRG